jgi:hypothetical protein
MLREGYQTAFEPVGHRPRQSGRSKYTNLGRLWASFSDLAGVIWLNSRARDPGEITERNALGQRAEHHRDNEEVEGADQGDHEGSDGRGLVRR